MTNLSKFRRAVAVATIVCGLTGLSGCRSTTVPRFSSSELEEARQHLNRPLHADPVALYRLRVPSSGGLRMAMQTSGAEGRLTVSEPFGSAVSITAWIGRQAPTFFDLRKGCRLEGADLGRVVGIDVLPLPQAVRLLAGRLPTLDNDLLSLREDGRFLVEGDGWAAVVTVAAAPWRVVAVEEAGAGGSPWSLALKDHTSSVPGKVQVEQKDGRWATLDLVNLEWKDGGPLPTLPDLPRCATRHP